MTRKQTGEAEGSQELLLRNKYEKGVRKKNLGVVHTWWSSWTRTESDGGEGVTVGAVQLAGRQCRTCCWKGGTKLKTPKFSGVTTGPRRNAGGARARPDGCRDCGVAHAGGAWRRVLAASSTGTTRKGNKIDTERSCAGASLLRRAEPRSKNVRSCKRCEKFVLFLCQVFGPPRSRAAIHEYENRVTWNSVTG